MNHIDLDAALRLARKTVSCRATVEIVRADTISPKNIKWLWQDWLALGKFAVLAGPQGTLKSSVAFCWSATVTIGGLFPDGSQSPIGSVLIWSAEDGIDDTIIPRFMANGGDRTRLYFINGAKDEKGSTRPFDPAIDFPMLENAAASIPDLRLIIVDPVVSAVAGDSHKNTEVRRGLQPLVDLAASTGAALLGITHVSKGTNGRDPVERVTGSLAFTALPRLVMMTAKPDKQDQSRRLVRAKSNIGPDGGGFEFDTQKVLVTDDIYAQAIVWRRQLSGTARDLINEVEKRDDEPTAPARDDATKWLLELLADEPCKSADVPRLATAAGLSMRTVNRAKSKLGIISKNIASSRYWVLPKVAK